MKRFFLAILALCALPLGAFAQTGTAIPGGTQAASYVIEKPGRYYLAADRTYTGATDAAIVVKTNDVTIDLNGNSIGTSSNLVMGILALSVDNLEVRGGSIRPGTYYGVFISGAGNVRLLDLRVGGANYDGAMIGAGTVLVERSHFTDCGKAGLTILSSHEGSLVTDSFMSGNTLQGGSLSGPIRATRCVFSHNGTVGVAVGIGSTVERCTISNNNLSHSTNVSAGIVAASQAVIRWNTLNNNAHMGILVASGADGVVIEGNVISSVVEVGGKRTGIVGPTIPSRAVFVAGNRYFDVGTATTGNIVSGGDNVSF